jgi:hypothetical protein
MQLHTPRRLIEITRSKSSLVASAASATSVVVCRVETSERRDGLLNHGLDLAVIGYVASDRECLVPAGRQLLGSRTYGLFVRVGQRHRSARLGKGLRRGEAQARSGARDKRNLVLKRYVHNDSLHRICAVSCG